MKLFEIEYQDDSGDSPVFTWRTKAWDADHAEMKFHDSDSEGWTILKIKEVAAPATERPSMTTPVAGTETDCHTER